MSETTISRLGSGPLLDAASAVWKAEIAMAWMAAMIGERPEGGPEVAAVSAERRRGAKRPSNRRWAIARLPVSSLTSPGLIGRQMTKSGFRGSPVELSE